MQISQQTSDKKTKKFTVSIPRTEVAAATEEIVNELIKQVEIKGFRRGHAPKNLARKQLKKETVLQEALKKLTVAAYRDTLKQYSLTPFGQPSIQITKAQEGQDWELSIAVAEKPTVTLKDYKSAIRALKAEKSTKIWTPDEAGKKEKEKQTDTKPELNEILEALYQSATVEIADMIVDQELDRMLARLIDDAQKLGLTIERYAQSVGKSIEELKTQYRTQAEKTVALELILDHIAQSEKIVAEDADIDAFIKKAKTDEERKNLQQQRYYLASLIRRQKTLEHLISV